MVHYELIVGIRNVLLVQLAMIILLMPGPILLVRQELFKIWRAINAPFQKKGNRKKANRFWEIDMSDFEP